MEWIKIEDRLPEKDGEYLTYSKYEFKFYHPNGKITTKIDFYIKVEEFKENEFNKAWNEFVKKTGYEDKKMKKTITHWQPLPKPPKN